MRTISAAIQFLTIIRVPDKNYTSEEIRESLRWFFLVGALLGLIEASLAWLALKFLAPVDLLAPALVILSLILTGGLHLDGVADTVEGFGAGRDRESILAIMRDTRLGVYGVAAIFFCLWLRLLAFQRVLLSGNLIVLILAPMLSRAFLAVTCTILPYARTEGTGKAFRNESWMISFPSLGLTVLLLTLCSGIRGLLLFHLLGLFSLGFSLYIRSRIGGFTGDTLGFQNEFLETSCILLWPLFVK